MTAKEWKLGERCEIECGCDVLGLTVPLQPLSQPLRLCAV